jgi:hypothetical protein
MNITHRAATLSAIVTALTLFSAAALAQSTHVLVPADQVQWGPAPAVLPPGAQIAVLEGNPGAPGDLTLRLKLPANYDIPPHWHSMTERVTVLSGALHVGMGDAIDREHSTALAPGGFVSLPSQMHHYAFTRTPTVVQINLQGPFDIFYVGAADAAQKRPSTR